MFRGSDLSLITKQKYPGPGKDLLPRLFDLSQKKKIPFWSYFCVGTDLIMASMRSEWLIPEIDKNSSFRFIGPETPWTDLLCARIKEFLWEYPVDWILFDWFVYGSLKPDAFHIRPVWFVEEPFQRIIGREMPERAEDITPTENLIYKREIMAQQFRRIQESVKSTSPHTRIIFNVPYWEPYETLWVGHPMLEESDALFAECSREDVVDWLLDIKKPDQRVMTTIIGRQESGQCDPESWVKWYKKGCDFFGYAWGTPPNFLPHSSYSEELQIVKHAFHEIR